MRKGKAVKTLLEDEEWSQWSSREIARQCEVSPKTVSKYRRESGVEVPQVRKGKAVKTLLEDEEWSQNSDNWIANEAKVSNHLVKAVREDLEISKSDVRKTSDGRTIDTSNIGNGQKEIA